MDITTALMVIAIGVGVGAPLGLALYLFTEWWIDFVMRF